MSPPFTPINCDSNVAIAENMEVGKSNPINYIQRDNNDFEYDCESPCFDLREERENHNPPIKNITKSKKTQKEKKKKNGPMVITFNNNIKETTLSEEIESTKKKKEIVKLLQNNKMNLIINSKLTDINMSNYKICGNCLKQYKKESYFIRHLQQKMCKLPATKKNKLINVNAMPSNDATHQYNEAGPSTSNNNLIIENQEDSLEQVVTISDTNPEMFKNTVKSMNSETSKFKSARDAEFKKFVQLARSTADADAQDEMHASADLKKLRARLVKLGPSMVNPLRTANPARHLTQALRIVARAKGLDEGAWDGLLRAALHHDAGRGPYRLMVAYMKAFVANVNAHCATKCSMLSPVTLREKDFRDNVLHDASCADLFRWRSRSLDGPARKRVRGAVQRMFADWQGDRLETHLLCRQYAYLRRRGVLRLSYGDPKRPRFRHVAVPGPADPDFALLRSFCVVGYSAGYLDFLRQALYCFALPLLEGVVDSCVAADGVFNEAVVLATVRRLNVAWFQTGGAGPYELSDLYEHRGFDGVRASVRDHRAEQRLYLAKVAADGAVDISY